MNIPFKDAIEVLQSNTDLPPWIIENSLGSIFSAQWNESQIASFLVALNLKGLTGEILATVARFLRKNSNFVVTTQGPEKVHQTLIRPFGDSCGTGGDGLHTFNISTLAAIIAAAGGLRIAKHGNRSITSLCGSADLLFFLGYPETLSSHEALQLFDETGLTFLFAPQVHPLMKSIGNVRKSLGIPTVFNYVGPLSNPLQPDFQIIGVNRSTLLLPMAEALRSLNSIQGLIIHSRDGLDEISPSAITDAVKIDQKSLTQAEIDPAAFGLKGQLHDLKGGDAATNSRILWKILDNDPEVQVLTKTVCLNAGSLFWTANIVSSLHDGFEKALEIVTSHKAHRYLKSWIQTAQKNHQGGSTP